MNVTNITTWLKQITEEAKRAEHSFKMGFGKDCSFALDEIEVRIKAIRAEFNFVERK